MALHYESIDSPGAGCDDARSAFTGEESPMAKKKSKKKDKKKGKKKK